MSLSEPPLRQGIFKNLQLKTEPGKRHSWEEERGKGEPRLEETGDQGSFQKEAQGKTIDLGKEEATSQSEGIETRG